MPDPAQMLVVITAGLEIVPDIFKTLQSVRHCNRVHGSGSGAAAEPVGRSLSAPGAVLAVTNIDLPVSNELLLVLNAGTGMEW